MRLFRGDEGVISFVKKLKSYPLRIVFTDSLQCIQDRKMHVKILMFKFDIVT
jgi:hypothetical protein